MAIFIALILSVCVVTANASAQETDIAECCLKAAEQMKRIESVAAFKLHANVTRSNLYGDFDHEVWLESRGDKVWAQVLPKPPPDTPEFERLEKIASLLKRDLRATYIFDGQKAITHSPLKMEVMIEADSSFQTVHEVGPLFPAAWTSFLVRRSQGKTTYSHLLTERLPECQSSFDAANNRVVVSLTSTTVDPSKPVSFALIKVEIDPSTHLIRSTEASGGRAAAVVATFDWANSEGAWYVSQGKVSSGSGKSNLTTEWKIDEFTANPRNVRTTFSLDESALPRGTRIEVEPHARQRKRDIRFVGEEGQREYDLKIEAIRLISQRIFGN